VTVKILSFPTESYAINYKLYLYVFMETIIVIIVRMYIIVVVINEVL